MSSRDLKVPINYTLLTITFTTVKSARKKIGGIKGHEGSYFFKAKIFENFSWDGFQVLSNILHPFI